MNRDKCILQFFLHAYNTYKLLIYLYMYNMHNMIM